MTQEPNPKFDFRFIWMICLVAAMGGLLFGYDWVVIGGAKPFYEPFFQITEAPFWQGFAMSSALFGCIFGAMVSGVLSDRFGRKRLLIFSGFLFTASAVWTALAADFFSFNLARFIGGVGIGLASNLSPMYIAEVSPARMRGRFVSINQLTIVIGILAAQIINWMTAAPVPTADEIRLLVSARGASVGGGAPDQGSRSAPARAPIDAAALNGVRRAFPDLAPVPRAVETKEEKAAKAKEDGRIMAAYIPSTWNGRIGWRIMFGAETAPAILFFALMFFVPESPRWLIKTGRDAEAAGILARIGGAEYAGAEVADVKATLSSEEIGRLRLSDLLEANVVRILALGVFLAVFQQWCGINVIFNYAQEVFAAADYEVGDLMFNIVITGVVNLLFTFVAIFTVDRWGRRPLMLFGAAGLAGIYAVLGSAYYLQSTGIHMLILVVAAIACYSMSLAPITWVVISEIFPNRIRGTAMSVAVLSLWAGCTALTFTFPILNRVLGAHGAFWLYGAICVLGFVVILRRLPETKGKSLEAIERELAN